MALCSFLVYHPMQLDDYPCMKPARGWWLTALHGTYDGVETSAFLCEEHGLKSQSWSGWVLQPMTENEEICAEVMES